MTQQTTKSPAVALLPSLLALVLWLLAAHTLAVPSAEPQAACPVVRLEVERLPQMNTPRSGHALLWVDGALMAVGGHTSGFVPTATAEFLHPGDTAWQQLSTVYIHDFVLSLPLRSGQVLLTGGAAEALGIGQTFTVERYDPVEGTFSGFGCLDIKRMYAQGVELDSGRVLISGNWYHDDNIELFDGQKSFAAVKPVSQPRCLPYLFRSAKDDVLIIGGIDNYGKPLADASWVDRLAGEAFRAPLLQQWLPLNIATGHYDAHSFIGDEQAGVYASLLPVVNAEGQVALAKVEGTDISLVPTACPVPMRVEDCDVYYFYSVIVDREARRAYLPGVDSLHRFYFFCTELVPTEGRLLPATQQGGARLYRTDAIADLAVGMPTLTPAGDVVMVGGATSDEYHPLPAAYRFLLGERQPAAVTSPSSASHRWLWLALGGAVLLAVCAFCVFVVRRRRANSQAGQTAPEPTQATPEPAEPAVAEAGQPKSAAMPGVLSRVNELMECERYYLNADLKLSDIADRLGLPKAQVSNAINTQLGCTFPQFLMRYRVEHAQQLLRQHPDKKLSSVSDESGFTDESSFFRAFKALTGLTPRQWLADQELEPEDELSL